MPFIHGNVCCCGLPAEDTSAKPTSSSDFGALSPLSLSIHHTFYRNNAQSSSLKAPLIEISQIESFSFFQSPVYVLLLQVSLMYAIK